MPKMSRRGLVKRLVTGAIVLGFDPRGRSWVTEARADTFDNLPPLDGVVSTDPGTLAAAADDFGHIVHRSPIAVLFPGSVNDIVTMINFVRPLGIRIAGRGKGHTVFGQSQADAGLVIDMSTLDVIHSISSDRADVDAGVVWRDLILATTAAGLTPPVLTDFTGLSVGGTLSVGGVSGTSYRYGAQVDNVFELQVVTGRGELVTCSPTENSDLFNAALAGLGLCGIIVRATIRLIPAKDLARTFRIFYADIPTMLNDMRVLIADQGDDPDAVRIDDVRGSAAPGPTGFVLFIEATTFYAAPDDPSGSALLAGLNYIPGTLQTEDRNYFDYTDIGFQLIQFLKQLGLYALPHPWLDLFVPGSAVNTFAAQTVAGLDPAGFIPGSLILFHPLVAARLSRPLLRIPSEEVFFLFDILRTTTPDPGVVSDALQFNRSLYDQNVTFGGTHYAISAVQLSAKDWKRHFQPEWGFLNGSKHHFDPENALGAGVGVFP